MNGNGKWDTGNVVERLQPERAEIYANDEGEDTFATKTNWEVEFSIDMNRVFAPVTMESLSRLLDEREAQRLRREAEKRAKEPKPTATATTRTTRTTPTVSEASAVSAAA